MSSSGNVKKIEKTLNDLLNSEKLLVNQKLELSSKIASNEKTIELSKENLKNLYYDLLKEKVFNDEKFNRASENSDRTIAKANNENKLLQVKVDEINNEINKIQAKIKSTKEELNTELKFEQYNKSINKLDTNISNKEDELKMLFGISAEQLINSVSIKEKELMEAFGF